MCILYPDYASLCEQSVMFYTDTILAKKGALAKVWLAAHWEKKLSKAQFLQTNIQSTVGKAFLVCLPTTEHLSLSIIITYRIDHWMP